MPVILCTSQCLQELSQLSNEQFSGQNAEQNDNIYYYGGRYFICSGSKNDQYMTLRETGEKNDNNASGVIIIMPRKVMIIQSSDVAVLRMSMKSYSAINNPTHSAPSGNKRICTASRLDTRTGLMRIAPCHFTGI